MAKGQVRTNKETKKPKQEKKPAGPISPFSNNAARNGATGDGKKK
jgi:hypothetical protein